MERNEFDNQVHEADGGAELTIRRALPRDRAAIERLAERDSRPAPRGEVLLAEIGRRPLAAISLDDGAAVADPFEHSAGAMRLLRMRGRQLRRSRRRRARGISHGRGALAGSPPGAGGRLLILPPR